MKFLKTNGIISDELKTIIENTNDFMFIKNSDFVYVASSQNYATNCIRVNGIEDVIGKTDFELYEDQSIAAKYREDDEKLFSSGKTMIEFQEEYPDENGKKHICLTTKYLLHNKAGKPVAIFGQYHDLGKQMDEEIAIRRDININIANALSKSYFTANYADLRTHKYITVKTKDYIRKVLENCETIEQAFEAFIKTLVKPEYQEKMREFCDSTTIAQRIKGKNQIDCEYLSNVAVGWCRTSFFPCEWDENGEVTHVLFAVSPIDETIANEIEEGISNKRNLETIFEEIQSGIAIYEWTGKEMKILKMSKYFKDLYGYDMIDDNGHPDVSQIHPDDIEGYKRAHLYAINVTHTLNYVFRVWNKNKNKYSWTQINAVFHRQPDETALIYAMYSDVTDQKEAELEAEKKQASLEAALNVSNQLCCEYDPLQHKIECFTTENFFHIPTPLNNYPECLREYDFVHPEDIDMFINIVHSIDDGQHSAHCDVRAKREGKYCWFSCRFQPYYDSEKERNVIILTIIDATLRMESIRNYKEQVNSMLSTKENTLSMCSINLTKNTFEMVGMQNEMAEFVDENASYEDVMLGVTAYMLNEKDKEKYRNLFCRKNLIKQANEGKLHAEMEYLLKFNETHYEWVTATVDMVKHPISGEVGGIAYSKSSQKAHMERELLARALKKDYVFAAVVFKDTDEFYTYNASKDGFGNRMEHFWDVAFSGSDPKCSPETIAYMKKHYKKDVMCKYLDENQEFIYAFDSFYTGEKNRLEAKFRYLDEDHTTILVTLRNITDQQLQEQWRYDSEHDALTGLLNRKTLFRECRKLLDKYPDSRFVMVHCDVQHFHLYNTFFGEKEGDNLLCRMAAVIEKLRKDYGCYVCGRIESDVFCIFLPEECETFEKNIRYCFQKLESFSPNFPIKLAIGAYWITDTSMSIEEMFTRATIAAKSNKKNLFGLISRYDENLDQELKDTQQITSEMTQAIENEEFEVYLQPKYSLRSEKMIGAEALVRWKHPSRGMISPGKFIPAFEKNGFIAELDRYMWEHVCRILRRWQDEGKAMHPVSVNISRVSMYSHATVPFLKSLIEKYELDPKYLELELTETAYMDDPEDLKRMLKELQEYGFKILMDDFGSGYSSLNTLRELPVDVLKLDMKFLSTEENDNRGLAVLSSVVRMSKLLNLPIVAEGVEKQEQADYLRSIGCEYVQGFLFGRPMPVTDYEVLLCKPQEKEDSEFAENVESVSFATADVLMEDPLIALGILEYDKEHFAYLRTNKKFLKEFDLIENLKPASKVFREHLNNDNYFVLLQAFADCSKTKEDILVYLNWETDEGITRKYHGYVHYNGDMGGYADLSVTFVNITGMKTYSPDNQLNQNHI